MANIYDVIKFPETAIISPNNPAIKLQYVVNSGSRVSEEISSMSGSLKFL